MVQDNASPNTCTTQFATIGGGCFWCLEAVYNELNGVQMVVSGYAGGHIDNPSYASVSSGITDHAEVVQITFDSTVVSFKELLEIFFTIHDPTTLNRQGYDIGTQYRSIVLYQDAGQKVAAEKVIREITEAGLWDDPIITEVSPLKAFYEAEEYHQQYFDKNPYQPYCVAVVKPKVLKFRREYNSKLKTQMA